VYAVHTTLLTAIRVLILRLGSSPVEAPGLKEYTLSFLDFLSVSVVLLTRTPFFCCVILCYLCVLSLGCSC